MVSQGLGVVCDLLLELGNASEVGLARPEQEGQHFLQLVEGVVEREELIEVEVLLDELHSFHLRY